MPGRFATKGMAARPKAITRFAAKAAKREVVFAGSLNHAKRDRRLGEAAEIVAHVIDWAGGPEEAERRFRSQPIPALGVARLKRWS